MSSNSVKSEARFLKSGFSSPSARLTFNGSVHVWQWKQSPQVNTEAIGPPLSTQTWLGQPQHLVDIHGPMLSFTLFYHQIPLWEHVWHWHNWDLSLASSQVHTNQYDVTVKAQENILSNCKSFRSIFCPISIVQYIWRPYLPKTLKIHELKEMLAVLWLA